MSVSWKKYSEWAVHHKRPATLAIERTYWGQVVEFVQARKLSDITSKHIEGVKAKRLRDGLRPRPVNGALRHVQAVYNYAKKLGYYSGPNPVQGVKRLKVPKNRLKGYRW